MALYKFRIIIIIIIKCPLLVNQPGQLSLPPIWGRKISSNLWITGGGDH